MGLNPIEAAEKTSSKFSFSTTILATFFGGSVCILLNGSLIIQALNNNFFSNPADMINKGILIPWLSLIQNSNGFFSIPIFFVLSFIIGAIMIPFERLTITIISSPLMLLTHYIKPLKRYKPFSPTEMVNEDYEHILGWLSTRPSERSHWEWELFNYYIYWSIVTNIIIFTILSSYVLNITIISIEFIGFILLCGVFISFALLHSIVMYKVHFRCKTIYRNSLKSYSQLNSHSRGSNSKNIPLNRKFRANK